VWNSGLYQGHSFLGGRDAWMLAEEVLCENFADFMMNKGELRELEGHVLRLHKEYYKNVKK